MNYNNHLIKYFIKEEKINPVFYYFNIICVTKCLKIRICNNLNMLEINYYDCNYDSCYTQVSTPNDYKLFRKYCLLVLGYHNNISK